MTNFEKDIDNITNKYHTDQKWRYNHEFKHNSDNNNKIALMYAILFFKNAKDV